MYSKLGTNSNAEMIKIMGLGLDPSSALCQMCD